MNSRVEASRIGDRFTRLRAQGHTGLITYVTAGDPDLTRSGEILRALDRAGADVLEVGVPFSDPLADGPIIQRASERALKAGANLGAVLDLVARVRLDVSAPVVLFSYANPLLRMGLDVFARRAADAGLDGVLALDLPIEEAGDFRETMIAAGLDPIFLLSQTSTAERIRRAASLGRGFLYAISRLGVTGMRDTLPETAKDLVERIRRETDLPIALGFGISSPVQVREAGRWADAAVVGSAIVRVVEETGAAPDLAAKVESYVRWLKDAGEASPQTTVVES